MVTKIYLPRPTAFSKCYIGNGSKSTISIYLQITPSVHSKKPLSTANYQHDLPQPLTMLKEEPSVYSKKLFSTANYQHDFHQPLTMLKEEEQIMKEAGIV